MAYEVSDEFMTAFCGGGTPWATCGFCGRSHFASNDLCCYEEGELEKLRRKAEEKPAEYIEHDYDSIGIGQLCGVQILWECKCEGVAKYEQFIWEHRHQIMGYFKAKTERRQREADSDASILRAIEEPEAEAARMNDG